MGRILVDVSLLREHPEFRKLWLGNVVSQLGTQFSTVAIAYEVYHLTNSVLDVGLISTIQLVPAVFGAVFGGSIADAMDRRKLLLVTNSVLAVIASMMAVDVGRPHPGLSILYVLAGLLSLVQSVATPTQTSLQTSIVGRGMILRASALTSVARQMSTILGPTLGGTVIATAGPKIAFWADAASFVVILAFIFSLRQRHQVGDTTPFGRRSIIEGFAFIRSRQSILGCFVSDLNATGLGMPQSLFPAMAVQHFHGGVRTLGFLYSAPSVGAFCAASSSGWAKRIRRPGYAVSIVIAIWGVALAAFGLVNSLALGLAFLAIAGGADMISAIFRGTIIQTESPDRLRGRLSSLQSAVTGMGPRIGNTEAGLVAAATNTRISVVSGGLGCVVGMAIIARLMPDFVQYRLPHATGEGELELA
jgi:MFS family permease